MSKKRLFEYAVLHHTTTTVDSEKEVETKILVEPTVKLAKDEKSLGMIIARQLPEDLLDDLDNVEILIKPF